MSRYSWLCWQEIVNQSSQLVVVNMCEGATEEVALLMPSNTGADLLLCALWPGSCFSPPLWKVVLNKPCFFFFFEVQNTRRSLSRSLAHDPPVPAGRLTSPVELCALGACNNWQWLMKSKDLGGFRIKWWAKEMLIQPYFYSESIMKWAWISIWPLQRKNAEWYEGVKQEDLAYFEEVLQDASLRKWHLIEFEV